MKLSLAIVLLLYVQNCSVMWMGFVIVMVFSSDQKLCTGNMV